MADDDILQDFLVEAYEILERLGEQLVELERNPSDLELLNSVFRGFHTIKGGAGFVEMAALVEVCHKAEDLFNSLRQGERKFDALMMDVVLRVVDFIQETLAKARDGEKWPPASRTLTEELEGILNGPQLSQIEAGDVSQSPTAEGSEICEPDDVLPAEPTELANEGHITSAEEITEDEFEALLDALHGRPATNPLAKSSLRQNAPIEKFSQDEELSGSQERFRGQDRQVQKNAKAMDSRSSKVPQNDKDTSLSTAKARVPATAQKKSNEEALGAEQSRVRDSTGGTGEASVRVDTKRLDDIMNLVGELVLVRNRLLNLQSELGQQDVSVAVANLDLVTSDLQAAVMKTRMQPIKKVFGRFPRVVRDLARQLGKEIALELSGEDTDLDKNLVEALADPLIHLVRNGVDHGIEDPKTRERAGKPRVGRLQLAAKQEGDHILLTIEDDGRGIDAEALRRKAVENGLMDVAAAERMTENECFNLILLPGFSTKREISDVSGRGVGMDVVKTSISRLNGTIDIESRYGEGTRIVIKVPLTLAIMPTLMVMLENQIFALPLNSVSEIFSLDLNQTNVVDGQPVVLARDQALPIFYLGKWLRKDWKQNGRTGSGHIVVVNHGTRNIGYVVDQLIGQEEVVIKPLGTLLQGIKSLAGATITGNGRIALILDVPGLMETYAGAA